MRETKSEATRVFGERVRAERLRLATKKLDKATSKGVIHANQAANKKSAIAKQVAAL